MGTGWCSHRLKLFDLVQTLLADAMLAKATTALIQWV